MAYVITEKCTKDEKCIEVCPVDCIHPRKEEEEEFAEVSQLFVHPTDCIDCGACVPVCEASAVFAMGEVPDEFKGAIEANAQFYA